MPTFYLSEHQHKGRPYAAALTAAGWARTEVGSDPEMNLALFDHDVAEGGRGFRKPLDYLHSAGVPVVMYPHAARPMLQWDGMYKVWPHTRLCLVIASGHQEVLRAYGYPIPTWVTGWAMCEIQPWQPVEVRDRPINVLWGPIHPNNNGFLHQVDKAVNAAVFQRLLETPGIRLTVRHIKSLTLNGIWHDPRVNYLVANPNGCTAEIDQADVVIGHQTFAYLAAARGKPLIMFGDDLTAHSGNATENFRWAATYPAYRDLMRYPVEVEAARSGNDLRKMLEYAMAEDAGYHWRGRFIGSPMDGEYVSRLMNDLLN